MKEKQKILLDRFRDGLSQWDTHRKYGWILARDKQLTKKTMEKIFALLEEKGYDPDRFMMTNQE